MRDELVRLDPRFAPEHAAYYLRGLGQHVGSNRLPLTTDGFPACYSENKPLAFVLRRGEVQRNIYIAADDMSSLAPEALEWADIYGKVNVDPAIVPPSATAKVVAIGPSHGLRIWSNREALALAVRTHRAGGRLAPAAEHYRRYRILQTRRGDEALYEPGVSEDRYIFYNSWLWAKHPDVNPPRAEFVRACQALRPRIEFEGGFIARRRNDVVGYEDVEAERNYALPEYLERVKRSTVVFNNPAVHRCHGWKLSEFLRLGKAIITLPPEREMPAPLVHGQHVHIVEDDREAMKTAILTILEDAAYRRRLEDAARRYYLEHLAPDVAIGRLADTAFGGSVPPGRERATAADEGGPPAGP